MKAGRLSLYAFWGAVTTIPIAGLVWSVLSPGDFQQWQQVSRDWIGQWGHFGPAVFVVIQIIQVVIPPISHYTVGAIGGYLYGPYVGGVLNYVGRVIGHTIAFAISRRFGRRWISKYVNLGTYDKIFSKGAADGKPDFLRPFILFLVFFLPLFPDDEISYLVGLSKMSKKAFVLANVFGQLGGAFSLAYLGSGVNTRDPWFWILTVSTLAGFPIIWWAFSFDAKRQRAENHK